jgi:hypothetical protein
MFPSGERMQFGNLPDYWREVDAAFDRLQAQPSLSEHRLLTARAFDEAKPAGPRTYIEVERLLNVARANNHALVGLLTKHGATVWAPYSLLRPTFETSFDALAEVRDLIHQQKHRDEIGSMRTYRAEAAALGIHWDRLGQKVNLVDEIPKPSAVQTGNLAPFIVATWRMLSGYEHGLAWASLRGFDSNRVAEVPGGVTIHMTINDDAFVMAGKTTYFLLLTACKLLERRHTTLD